MADEKDKTDEAALDLEALKTKTKDELERIKLAKDIMTYEATKRFERSKYTGDTIRIFILALLSSIITLGTTYIFKSWDQKNALVQEARKELHEDLKEYNSAKDSSVEQTNWACTIANLDNPDNNHFSDSVINRYKIICNTQATIQGHYSSIVATSSKAPDSSKEKKDISNYLNYSNIVDSLKNLKQTKSRDSIMLNNTIKTYQARIDSLAIHSTDVKSIRTATNEINKTVDFQVKSFDNKDDKAANNNIKKDYGSAWFKTGYFLQFDDMRVLLQYLDKQLGIQVQVCQTTGSEICSENNSIVTKEWISYNRPLVVNVGKTKYQISLQTIDHAGNNPFTLAAYINVIKLEQ